MSTARTTATRGTPGADGFEPQAAETPEGQRASALLRQRASALLRQRASAPLRQRASAPLGLLALVLGALVLGTVAMLGCGIGLDAGLSPPPATIPLTVTDGEGTPIPALVTLRTPEDELLPLYSTRADVSHISPGVYGITDSVALLTGEGVVPVTAGTWRMTVSRGPEYEIYQELLEISPGEDRAPLTITLEQALNVAGYLSADLHVHSTRSEDSVDPVEGRVAIAAASGLDVIVSADHNIHTDFGPAIEAMGMEQQVASLVGLEITLDWGHFNAFPVPYDPDDSLGGALTRDELIDLGGPREIFAYYNALPTAPLVQVNHPRTDSAPGYFAIFSYDSTRCAAIPDFSPDFQLVEVLNGLEVMEPYISQALADLYCLMRTGHLVTATGNSDSHTSRPYPPGYPRNYVATGDDDASTFTQDRFMAALESQQVVVSTGPFVTISSGGAGMGELVAAQDGSVPLRVVVQAASWVPADGVRIIVGGETALELPVPATGRPRLDESLELPVTEDTFVLALVFADTPLPAAVVGHTDLPSIALTNPILIDADGDGLFAPQTVPPSTDQPERPPRRPLHLPLATPY